MSKTFRVTFTGEPSELISKAKDVASSNGAYFSGDEDSGTFSGSGVSGNYVVEENTVIITVKEKPFLAPWGLVENKIRAFFNA